MSYEGHLFIGFLAAEDSEKFDEDDYKEANRSICDFLLGQNPLGVVKASEMPNFLLCNRICRPIFIDSITGGE